MGNYGHFETELYSRFPELDLKIRNFCNEGDTPCFRPHAGRELQFAFEGAGDFVNSEYLTGTGASGFYPTPDEWLAIAGADTVIALFGYASSFGGEEDLERFREELDVYVKHLQKNSYNGTAPPRIVLVSPLAMEGVEGVRGMPDLAMRNKDLRLYSEVIMEVAASNEVSFVDAYTASMNWFSWSGTRLTRDGVQLTDDGYALFGEFLADMIYAEGEKVDETRAKKIHLAVQEKNELWNYDYKVPNGVHVYGKRHKPYGPENYPSEIQKTREMTEVRDRAIWAVAKGLEFDLAAADARTLELPEIKTNYRSNGKTGDAEYLYGEEAISKFKLPEGYRIELFADERKFPNLANPVQMSFDGKGRLWVACMPSYPHWRPGDPRAKDSILIFEDTDGDGIADKETVFADDLHLPIGFEITGEGVYVSQGQHLVLLKDVDGDDRYDEREIVFSGFDDHDTHHAMGAFTADPSGALILSEGLFLHSNVETAHGVARGTNGGFFRFSPKRHQLERTTNLNIPNPWGTAYDDWGQPFFIHTSGPDLSWMTPGIIKPRYGRSLRIPNIVREQMIRPNSGLEIVSSRHFPDEVQGDLLVGNVIGLRGIRQYSLDDDGTGYRTAFRQDLLGSADGNFRPADLEFAPDGSLYLLDWANTLIGHMQHSTRDPLRDHAHGRIYRITYPGRPLVKPARIDGAPLEVLLDNLKLPEYRSRYRTRAELRARDAGKVDIAVDAWVATLDKEDENYERHLLEAFWVKWGIEALDEVMIKRLLQAKDSRVRAAAVQAIRHHVEILSDADALLAKAAADPNGRVRLEAVIAASWFPGEEGLAIVGEADKQSKDGWIQDAIRNVRRTLGDSAVAEEKENQIDVPEHLDPEDAEAYRLGHEVFLRDIHCATCHMENGQGIDPVYPPLAGSEWVTGSDQRLIKLVLDGVSGKMMVAGKEWGANSPPMMAFRPMIESDEELAAVLTYVRNSWGNKAPAVSAKLVGKIRAKTAERTQPWTPEELLKAHPMENGE